MTGKPVEFLVIFERVNTQIQMKIRTVVQEKTQ